MERSALFIDRDGVLVNNINGLAAKTAEQLSLIPNAIQMLLDARRNGFLLIIVSNQPDVALGNIKVETRVAIEETFIRLLSVEGIKLDGIYYCYHHANSKDPMLNLVCDCRKPAPGLILQAAKEHKINLSTSFIIGDRATDIKAGEAASVGTILYDPASTQKSFLEIHEVTPKYIVNNLLDVAKIIQVTPT